MISERRRVMFEPRSIKPRPLFLMMHPISLSRVTLPRFPWIKIRDGLVARTLMGGGGGILIHIFMFCTTSFFSNQIQIRQFDLKRNSLGRA